jgi:hypothetical protein
MVNQAVLQQIDTMSDSDLAELASYIGDRLDHQPEPTDAELAVARENLRRYRSGKVGTIPKAELHRRLRARLA